MSFRKILVAAALATVLAGCSHSGRSNQYANVQHQPPPVVYANPAFEPGSGKGESNGGGIVIYEEPPHSLQSQDLPPEIAEEFKRKFRNQPERTSSIGESGIRGALQRVSTRGELPQVVGVSEDWTGHAPYELDTGDRLRVSVYEQEELSKTYAVDGSGAITVPLIGRVNVRGRTTSAVARSITRKLAREFVKEPEVTVDVQEYRPFFIMGEVNNGGKYPYVHGMTVQTAVAIAGGYGPRASTHYAIVTRRMRGRSVTAKVGESTPILPGDVVKIEERWF